MTPSRSAKMITSGASSTMRWHSHSRSYVAIPHDLPAHEPRTPGSVRPLNNGGHLLGVERSHGRCPDVAERAKLEQCGGGGLVVREVDDADDVVLAECPENLTDLTTVLLDEAPEVPGPMDG